MDVMLGGDSEMSSWDGSLTGIHFLMFQSMPADSYATMNRIFLAKWVEQNSKHQHLFWGVCVRQWCRFSSDEAGRRKPASEVKMF